MEHSTDAYHQPKTQPHITTDTWNKADIYATRYWSEQVPNSFLSNDGSLTSNTSRVYFSNNYKQAAKK